MAASFPSNFEVRGSYLVKYTGEEEQIVIPDSVIEIGDSAFKNCKSLVGITIPDGITEIGYNAFEGCNSLTSITIPASVTKIGFDAFKNCKSLVDITIPDGVTEIGDSAFENCKSLTRISIPSSVKVINSYALQGCKSLEHIIIPEGVTEIGEWVFDDCKRLKSIRFSASVSKIGSLGFTLNNSLRLFVHEGSYGEKYAINNYVKHELISMEVQCAENNNRCFEETPCRNIGYMEALERHIRVKEQELELQEEFNKNFRNRNY
jgi:hypothetical protein